MSLWYLMLTQDQANNLNDIFVPLYSPYPYVPANGGLYPYVDGSDFANSVNDSRLTTAQQDYIASVQSTKKDYDQAVAAGWIIPDD